jgi:hypothetical protein
MYRTQLLGICQLHPQGTNYEKYGSLSAGSADRSLADHGCCGHG